MANHMVPKRILSSVRRFAVSSKPQERFQYQLRLVERFDGRRIVTHGHLAHAKSIGARDKTLDFIQATNDRAALGHARKYVGRSDHRKGTAPGEFQGVVVVRSETDTAKPGLIRRARAHQLPEVTNRRRRRCDTTIWLYYVDPSGAAYNVDAKSHTVKSPVV